VLNAAFPGETAVSAQYLLRERVLPEEPDVVVLTFSANNAFRWSSESDAERYANFELRKLALRSHLVQLPLRWIVRHLPIPPPPRSAEALAGARASERKRVAGPLEYERALVEMIARSRGAGARVALVILPRASQVSMKFLYEDAAQAVRRMPLEPRASDEAEWTDQERSLIGFSCLDGGFEDVVAALHDGIGDWHPMCPGIGTEVQKGLSAGARDFASGKLERATRTFERIVKEAPDSPLAHYDLAVAQFARGDSEEGLGHLARAEEIACNVFLRYQAITWRVALEHEVPVVDAVLHFQTRGVTAGGLFLDPAHPSPEGHAIIARALADELAGRLPASHGGGM
jgi:lysophospholipase L1-like esterase